MGEAQSLLGIGIYSRPPLRICPFLDDDGVVDGANRVYLGRSARGGKVKLGSSIIQCCESFERPGVGSEAAAAGGSDNDVKDFQTKLKTSRAMLHFGNLVVDAPGGPEPLGRSRDYVGQAPKLMQEPPIFAGYQAGPRF